MQGFVTTSILNLTLCFFFFSKLWIPIDIFKVIFQYRLVKKTNIKIEKLDIIKNSESVGIEFSKSRIWLIV